MTTNIPKHVGIIMDGNGRWGKARGLTRSEGHYAGVQAMEKVIDASLSLGIKVLTLYAFSSENWSRSKEEVNYLMRLPVRFFKQKLPEFMKRNVRITVSGEIEDLPKATKKSLLRSIEETKNNDGMVVNFAFNYGGRNEILRAVRQVVHELQEKDLELSEEIIHQHLYTKDFPDPELIIRTGGEQRLSNFLLWQCAEAELYFTDVYFPDFNESHMQQAIVDYQQRKAVVDYNYTALYGKAK